MSEESPSTRERPPLIEFDGPWTVREKQRVRGVVCSIEAESPLPVPPREAGPIWVATKSTPLRSSALVVYAISRWHVEVVASTSLEELFRHLRQPEVIRGPASNECSPTRI